MSIMKLPDVNFGTSGYWLFGNSQSQFGVDTVAGNSIVFTLTGLRAEAAATTILHGLFVYKGVPPTQSELDAAENVTSLINTVTQAYRYADLLVYLPFASVTTVKNCIQAYFSPGTAISSGMATWFLLGTAPYSAGYPALYEAGTVGAVGSGADLEVADTNIVSGTVYKQPAMNLVFPNSMSA